MSPVIPAAHTHTQPTSRLSNKHLSVDAEGNTHVDLEFIEEPLGISAEQGHGFLRIEFGDAIGPDCRYRIVRKLGWGMNSNIWMAFDKQYVVIRSDASFFDDLHREKTYVAIKALKGYATDLVQRNVMWELAALERVASQPPILGFASTHCTQLLSHFLHPGKDQDGDHLCLVTDILGGDVKSFQVGMNSVLPLPLVKRILLHTLRGIAHMHSCNIIHTDLKHDNIMFDASSLTNDAFAALLEADPSRRHPPEESWNCAVQAAVSQPLPLPSLSEAMKRTYIVSDFGSGENCLFCWPSQYVQVEQTETC
jgi:serine/threonine protein kinase